MGELDMAEHTHATNQLANTLAEQVNAPWEG